MVIEKYICFNQITVELEIDVMYQDWHKQLVQGRPKFAKKFLFF